MYRLRLWWETFSSKRIQQKFKNEKYSRRTFLGNSNSFGLDEMYDLDLMIEFNKAMEEEIAKAQDIRLSSKGIEMIFVVY